MVQSFDRFVYKKGHNVYSLIKMAEVTLLPFLQKVSAEHFFLFTPFVAQKAKFTKEEKRRGKEKVC